MVNRKSTFGFIGLIIILVVALSGMFWINLQISRWGFGGNDFYVNWFGARALIVDGISPYSNSVISEIRNNISGETTFLNAEGSVISAPMYSTVLNLPFAMIEDFVVARALWITSQQVALIIMIFVLLRITKWQPKLWEFAILFVSLFLSHLAITAYISGNMVIWTSLLFVLAIGAINGKRDEIAGGLLALTTFQPQVFIITVVFILFWAITKRRLLILVWFLGLVFILTTIGILLIPGWPLQYLRILSRFIENFPYIYLKSEIAEQWPGIGVQLSWINTILIFIILIVEWWLARAKEFRWFIWTTCLTLVLSRLIGVPVHFMHNFVLFIPLMVVYAIFQERWQKAGRWLIFLFIFLFLGGWIQLVDKIFNQSQPAQFDLLFPFPIFLLMTLYWVRWWAIRPFRLYIQEMLSGG